mmetsp:Transcript_42257/g.119902  ORF Transcript_42257/g.119902 Transcript_42257/m.119902 type:complete len:149 (+) Transcript_42257:557-1003(+)
MRRRFLLWVRTASAHFPPTALGLFLQASKPSLSQATIRSSPSSLPPSAYCIISPSAHRQTATNLGLQLQQLVQAVLDARRFSLQLQDDTHTKTMPNKLMPASQLAAAHFAKMPFTISCSNSTEAGVHSSMHSSSRAVNTARSLWTATI